MPPRTRTIRAVVFDLDDTLYPERDYVLGGYRAVGEHLRKALNRDDPFEAWLWNRFLTGRTDRALDALGDHFGLKLPPERIAELVRVYREHRPRIRPYGGIPELLSRLRETHRLGLLSDGFLPAQRLKLDALKIGRFFDAVVLTEELGREAWKPATRGFKVIREKLDVPHEACAYVGDNPAKDFVAPNKLGWVSIQYLLPGQIHAGNATPAGGRPQRLVRSPDQLRTALRSIR